MAEPLDSARRKQLLEAVCDSLHPKRETTERPRTWFLPLRGHGEMLDNRIFVVVGERGAGKTALFRFLDDFAHDRVALNRVFPGGPSGLGVFG